MSRRVPCSESAALLRPWRRRDRLGAGEPGVAAGSDALRHRLAHIGDRLTDIGDRVGGLVRGVLGGGDGAAAQLGCALGDGVHPRGERTRGQGRDLHAGADDGLDRGRTQRGGAADGQLGQHGRQPVDGGLVGLVQPLGEADDALVLGGGSEGLEEPGPVLELVLKGKVAEQGLGQRLSLLEPALAVAPRRPTIVVTRSGVPPT